MSPTQQTFNPLRSRTGLALMAIRDNEAGAARVGIAVARNQLAAFLISAAVCAGAGREAAGQGPTADWRLLVVVFKAEPPAALKGNEGKPNYQVQA